MREITYLDAVREALAEEMRRDAAVVLLGEDIHDPFGGVYKATRGLQTEFGERRVRPTPISEAGFVGVGIGAALTGLRPVVEVMLNDFLALTMDQLANHAAKLHYMTGGQARVPLTIRTVVGGNRGSAAQHSQHLEAWPFHVPGLKLAMPATAADAKGVLKTAIRDDDPVIVFENSNLYYRKFTIEDDVAPVPIGTARLVREGSDVTVVATSRMVSVVEEAADTAAERGISLEVIDLRWLKPGPPDRRARRRGTRRDWRRDHCSRCEHRGRIQGAAAAGCFSEHASAVCGGARAGVRPWPAACSRQGGRTDGQPPWGGHPRLIGGPDGCRVNRTGSAAWNSRPRPTFTPGSRSCPGGAPAAHTPVVPTRSPVLPRAMAPCQHRRDHNSLAG
jgi:acetoin:2,6-dichlorophenolindophenol oxidoreductase subunit beta